MKPKLYMAALETGFNVWINPLYIVTVLPSKQDKYTTVTMSDGRSYVIAEAFHSLMKGLENL